MPTHLDHEIQILRMTHNYVRVLGDEVFKNAGLLNLQRIFMDNCHMQVRSIIIFLRKVVVLPTMNMKLCIIVAWSKLGNTDGVGVILPFFSA